LVTAARYQVGTVVCVQDSNRPTHRVYAVIKKQDREKGTWLEIGAAWRHRDGKRQTKNALAHAG
jgi:hypothetical protein